MSERIAVKVTLMEEVEEVVKKLGGSVKNIKDIKDINYMREVLNSDKCIYIGNDKEFEDKWGWDDGETYYIDNEFKIISFNEFINPVLKRKTRCIWY